MTTAALLRVSTRDQDEDRQRQDILEHCRKQNLAIPSHLWFIDFESRDRADFRPEFQRLLELVRRCEVKTVLIQTFDRFGVSDEIEFFHFHHLFRKAGCRLYSLKQGDLFTKDVSTVVQNLFRAKASEEELTQKSFRGLDGMVKKVRDGKVVGAVPAYGYDKAVYSGDGRLLWTAHYLTRSHAVISTYNAQGEVVDTRECQGKKQLPKRGESEVTRWHLSGDKTRVELVKYVFQTYTTEVITTRQLAVRLNREGHHIYGRPFTHMQVEATLRNPCYLGWFAYNRTSQAHRQEVINGQVVEVEEEVFRRYKYQGKVTLRRRRPEEWITKKGVFPQLIDDATFAEAQRRLANRSRRCLPPRSGDRWLKGLLVCGGCGQPMAVKLNAHSKVVNYICRSYQASHHRHGENQSRCGRNTIPHAEAVELIRELNADIEMFFVEFDWNLERALQALTYAYPNGRVPTLEQVKTLDAGLDGLGVGIGDAADQQAEQTHRELDQKKAEYERWVAAKVFAGSQQEREVIAAKVRGLEADIMRLEQQSCPADVLVQAAASFRRDLQDALRASEPDALSDKLRRAYKQIVLQFRHERNGRRMRSWVLPDQTTFVLAPNSSPPPDAGSPCGPPSPTGRTPYTLGCRGSMPEHARPTSSWPNSPTSCSTCIGTVSVGS
ncbi:MAG: recombinase family protein [Bacteroidales bacterium]|nr:recombinase family protein [Bacteroidales bacterium]